MLYKVVGLYKGARLSVVQESGVVQGSEVECCTRERG